MNALPSQLDNIPRHCRPRSARSPRERDAVILAHNYQLPEIQDVADYVGDSLGLSHQAAAADADVIAFCGVHFMAETASILSPEKTVLLPDLDAGCSLADSITAEQLRAWKAEHPGAIIVMYVNTTAEVKAETDYCVTSSNAVAVVEHILREHGADTEILFGPDMFLGAYVERRTGRPMHVWDGECHVHAGIRPRDIAHMRAEHPGADFLIHPECGCSTSVMEYVAAGDVDSDGVHMLSTGGMLRLRADAPSPATTAIVATEIGMLHPLRMAAPGRRLRRRQRARELPLHEDDHAAQAARRAARRCSRGQGARRRRRARAPADRADGRDRPVGARRPARPPSAAGLRQRVRDRLLAARVVPDVVRHRPQRDAQRAPGVPAVEVVVARAVAQDPLDLARERAFDLADRPLDDALAARVLRDVVRQVAERPPQRAQRVLPVEVVVARGSRA